MFDHSILSPSGRVSKRSRKVALERARVDIFGPQGLKRPGLPKQPTEKESILRQARELREMADRGMRPRAFRKEADRLEALVNRDGHL